MKNFRNYELFEREFDKNINFITGENGIGKTSILEGIYIIAISKSFRTNSLKNAIKNNEDFLQLFGYFNSEAIKEINLNYTKQDGKKIFINGSELDKKTDLIGKVPIIVLSPSDQRITEGSNKLRKNFINQILSQIDDKYFNNLLEYNKRLKDRNKLLKNYRDKNKDDYDLYIETLDEKMSENAEVIYKKRIEFIKDFKPKFKKNFTNISHFGSDIDLKINYKIDDKDEGFKRNFLNELKSRFKADVEKGYTSTGIQRDKIDIYYNDSNIREVGSQGEHKLALISLKITEGEFIKKNLNDDIIFLLDDLFTLLDEKHCMKIIKNISRDNQIFITATNFNNINLESLKESSYSTIDISEVIGNG